MTQDPELDLTLERFISFTSLFLLDLSWVRILLTWVFEQSFCIAVLPDTEVQIYTAPQPILTKIGIQTGEKKNCSFQLSCFL